MAWRRSSGDERANRLEGAATTPPPGGDPVAWHDAENGAYTADLALWKRLAAARPGGVVDLGSGTGRVALPLAEAGCAVVAVDADRALLDVLSERARERGLAVETACCDVRSLDLGRTFPLIVAPMQLLHILGGAAGRRRALAAIGAHLAPGGRLCRDRPRGAAADRDRPPGSGARRP